MINGKQYLLCDSAIFLWHEISQNVQVTSNIIWFSAQEVFQGEAETLTGNPSKSWLLNNWEGTDRPSAHLGMAAAALGEIVFTAVGSKAADGVSGNQRARKGEPIPGEVPGGTTVTHRSLQLTILHGHLQGCSSAPLPRLCSQGKQKDLFKGSNLEFDTADIILSPSSPV